MNLPVFPDFRALVLEDREELEPFFRRFPQEISESTFANHFIWRRFDDPRFTLINGNLCIRFSPPDQEAYFLQPLGENDIPATINACLSAAPRLSRIPASFAERWCGGLRCAPDLDDFDYVYRTEDLAELKGKRYDGKRNRIKKFEKSHAWRYVPIGPGDLDACRALFEEWLAGKGQEGGAIDAQKDAIQEALLHYRTLGLIGGAIETEGALAALAIGERLNARTAVIHIEIVSPRYEGLAQLMNREYVRREWADSAFINREQDLGVPGLRRAKQSYHPDHLVEKYHILA
ncbi:MAG: phosphatidylglycerol lysyltransferase domain-containing protein [Acidobacteriota bacterium]|nr:phosphatidylglycerol lysyltransferase domain-containing protein [Acidobacteriota bacterium]